MSLIINVPQGVLKSGQYMTLNSEKLPKKAFNREKWN